MSLHEKERNKKMPTPVHITPSLHLCFFQDHNMQTIGCEDVVLFALPHAFITNNMLKQNKDVGMGL